VISSDTEPDSLANIEREVQILLTCNHPNVVKCYGVEVVDESVWLIMDYYAKGSLADIMAKERRTYSEI
jgi:serine/threonine protein kinase